MGPITPFLEVDDFLYGVFYPGQPNNRGHVNDPALNEMLITQRRELDPRSASALSTTSSATWPTRHMSMSP